MTQLAEPAPSARLPFHRIISFSCLAVPATPILLLIGVYLPRFYAGHVGVTLGAVGAAFGLVRLIDIAFDPLVGLVMDRTRTPIGRYRPYVIAAAPILMIAIYKLFLPAKGVGLSYMVLWLVVLYAGNSMYILGQAAWGAVLATDYHERSRTYGWMQALGVAATAAFLMLPALTHGKIQPGRHDSMGAIGLLLVVTIPSALAATLLFTPEKITPQAGRPQFRLGDYVSAISRPDMRRLIFADLTLSFGTGLTGPIYLFFFHDAKGFGIPATSSLLFFYIAAGLFGSPAWAALAKRVGKPRTVQVACIAYAICQSVLMMLPRAQYLPTAAAMFAVGLCASAFVPIVRAMVADVGDEIRLETAKNINSVLYSMVTTTQKVALAMAVFIVLPVLGMAGYNAAENAVNTPQAIFALEMCYLFAPIFFVAIGALTMIGFRLTGERHAEVRAALDARDAAAIDIAASEEAITGPTAAPSAV
ncbi:MFS transporter [Phenylobacterium montanum]|uniref:MFS transporter n=1 Tax=Phenylobacterium montanum TaxID=2823693 RepID=A0A975IWD1_9CAUL|nr:MFS transporter [Caulobacter sp. S6]QUD89748.1 MFS transporter [Caulobacter sp. S6]